MSFVAYFEVPNDPSCGFKFESPILSVDTLKKAVPNSNGLLKCDGVLIEPSDGEFKLQNDKRYTVLSARTMKMIIEQIHKDYPDWKCFIDKPVSPPVDRKLPWTGREKEMQQLQENALHNIKCYLQGIRTKQTYRCDLVHGGMGVGKSRLVVESNAALATYFKTSTSNLRVLKDTTEKDIPAKDIFGHIVNIFLDFSRTDQLEEDNIELAVALGLRLASHFFFGKGYNMIKTQITNSMERNVFSFYNVVQYISNLYGQDKPLLLTIQMDEFGDIPSKKLTSILTILGTQMTSESRVCLVVQLTGTDTSLGINALHNSQLHPTPLLLEPLKLEEDVKLTKTVLNEEISDLLMKAIDCLGRVPRYIEYFLTAMEEPNLGNKVFADFISAVLRRVTTNIEKAYNIDKWSNILKSREGVRTMILWALSKRQVALSDKLNGITVEQARKTGILILQKVTTSAEERYILLVPLIVIRALNESLNDVPDELLDPIRSVDDREFENVMSNLRVLRQQLFLNMGKIVVTFRDLYPGALGYPSMLDQKIDLRTLSIVATNGQSSRQDSMHQHKMSDVPVLGCKTSEIDITKRHLVRNVHMAPSNDALIVHPGAIIEGIQYKSSDGITRREEPSAELVLGENTDSVHAKTIWGEYNKVTDTAHKNFYNQCPNYKFFLIVISNKKLKNYEEISKAVLSNNTSYDFPKNVAIICHQNFESFAGTFAHRGLFLPIKAKIQASRIFKDCVITFRGKLRDNHEKLAAKVTENGGVYKKSFSKLVTHVVSKDALTKKEMTSLNTKVLVVSQEWLYDSIKQQKRLPESEHLLKKNENDSESDEDSASDSEPDEDSESNQDSTSDSEQVRVPKRKQETKPKKSGKRSKQ